MFDIGMQEIIVIIIVALLVFGPKRLPELSRTIGKGLSELRRAVEDAKYQVDRELREEEERLKVEDTPSAHADSVEEGDTRYSQHKEEVYTEEGKPEVGGESNSCREEKTDV